MSFVLIFHNQNGGWVGSDGYVRDFDSGAILSTNQRKYFRTCGGAVIGCCGSYDVCVALEGRFQDAIGTFEELLPELEKFAQRIFATRPALPGAQPLGVILAARDRVGDWRSCKITAQGTEHSNDGWTGPWLGAEDQLNAVLPEWGARLIAAPQDDRPDLMRRTVAAAAAACPTKIGGTVFVEPLELAAPVTVTQIDTNGNIIVLGTAGTGPRLNVGNGTMTPSTGGKQMKRFYVTAPTTAGYSDGQVFYFTQGSGTPYLTDQAGAALSGFDNPPYVALFPYGMTSPPQSFYAAGISKTQFTMHALNGVTSTSASTALSSGTNSTYTVGAGDTVVTVNVIAHVSTVVDVHGPLNTPVEQNQTMQFAYTVTSNGGTVTNGTGSVNIVWNSDGNAYGGSGSISCSVPAGDVITVNVTWTNDPDATGTASYYVTYSQATGATGVNFIAMIGENW